MCALGPVVVWVNEREWWNHWSTQWLREERRAGPKEQYSAVLAKVKNHAMVYRGLVLSTGRSDYIYAGTQVLLNTLLFALHLPPCLLLYTPLYSPLLSVPLFLSSLVLPRSSPGTNGYLLYNSHYMFVSACTCPQQHVKQKRKWALSSLINYSSVHKRLLNGDVKAPIEMSWRRPRSLSVSRRQGVEKSHCVSLNSAFS